MSAAQKRTARFRIRPGFSVGAACEVGMAWAAGVPTIGLAAPTEKPGLILNRAVRFWAADIEECLAVIEDMAGRGGADAGQKPRGGA